MSHFFFYILREMVAGYFGFRKYMSEAMVLCIAHVGMYLDVYKVPIVDLNCSTLLSYENVLVDQILEFLEFFYYFSR